MTRHVMLQTIDRKIMKLGHTVYAISVAKFPAMTLGINKRLYLQSRLYL